MTRLSPQMLRMLEDIQTGLGSHGTAYRRGEHGGRSTTVRALRRHGLIEGNELSDAGVAALADAKSKSAKSNL